MGPGARDVLGRVRVVLAEERARRSYDPVDARDGAVVPERFEERVSRSRRRAVGRAAQVFEESRFEVGGVVRVEDGEALAVDEGARLRRVERVRHDERARGQSLPRPEVTLPLARVRRDDHFGVSHELVVVAVDFVARAVVELAREAREVQALHCAPHRPQHARARLELPATHAQRADHVQRPVARVREDHVCAEVVIRERVLEREVPRQLKRGFRKRGVGKSEFPRGLAHEGALEEREVLAGVAAELGRGLVCGRRPFFTQREKHAQKSESSEWENVQRNL